MPERNTSLAVSREQAVALSDKMRHDHRPLARPVVVLNGYRGLPSLANRIARKLREMTSGDRADLLPISYTLDTDFDRIAAEVVRRVDARWPSADPDQTVEVDVVGISMGGLVARWAALPPAQRFRGAASTPPGKATGKRLRIAHLFTISTPHRGAGFCDSLAPDAAARDMRRGSPFLGVLDAALPSAPYELVCYGQLRDHLVGATRCAPEGRQPIWTSGTFLFSHFKAGDNPLFLADIARRLRREPALLEPGPPPPCD